MGGRNRTDEYGNVNYSKEDADEKFLGGIFNADDDKGAGKKHIEEIRDPLVNRDEEDMGGSHYIEVDRIPFTNGKKQPDPAAGKKSVIHKLGSMGIPFADIIKGDVNKPESGSPQTESESSMHRSDGESLEGSEINLCISETKLQDLKQKSTLRQKLQKLLGVRREMNQKEFDSKIRIIYKCCLNSVRDLHELHLRRLIGLEILEDIIARAKSITVSMTNVIHITWSVMSCIHHFQLRLRTVSTGLVSYSRRKKVEEIMKSYSQLIRLFRPEMHRIILNAIITFYREGKLWEIEFACTDLIVQLLQIYQDAEEGIEDILYTMGTSTLSNVHEGKCLTQILYEILKKVRWRRMSEHLMKKILSMLDSSIIPKPTDHYNFVPLKEGLEICIKNTIGNLGVKDLMKMLYFLLKKLNERDLDDETIMCFGNLTIYGAKKFRIKSQRIPISEGPLPHIFLLFQMNNYLLTLYATRIWQSLIDRNNNSMNFLSPRIFLQDCNYGLRIPLCQDIEKAFIKTMRHLVYEISFNTFVNAINCRTTLVNMYQAIALTLVEVPCGYTASCFITVAMSLQDYAFSITQDKLVKSHHLHATTLSLLTLICYIHNATVFYDYVNLIMERRAEWAPHLNPPLRSHYEYAQHHVLWNKPELFFEDWEARYGLWKCFRTKRPSVQHKSVVV